MKEKLIVWLVAIFGVILYIAVIITDVAGIRLCDKYEPVIEGYYSDFEVRPEMPFQDYTNYFVYYYFEEYDEKFVNHVLYKEISENNIEDIKDCFQDFEKWMATMNKENAYKFDYDSITVGDYVYIKERELMPVDYTLYAAYNIYFYDMDEHILYNIDHNI